MKYSIFILLLNSFICLLSQRILQQSTMDAAFNSTRTTTPPTMNALPYATYQYQPYDDDHHPEWHTKDSPPRNSAGDLMELTAPEPNSDTTPEVPVPIQEVQVVNGFARLEWQTCDYDSAGCPIGFDGKLWSQYQVVKLRSLCSKLQVYGVKNARKDHIMDAIVNTYNNLQVY
jgi:hypothetical protein